MSSSRIYSDFASDIAWIRDSVASDVLHLGRDLSAIATYYVTKRLKILPGGAGRVNVDPLLGRPVPYAAFWFADAFKVGNSEFARQMGLCLVYNSLTTTLKDDLNDSSGKDAPALRRLEQYWSRKYDGIMQSTFPTDSAFWKTSGFAKEEWRKYDEWNSKFDENNEFNPYSDKFLSDSSRYFVAVVYPSLAGIAAEAGFGREIPKVGRFLKRFSKGWRIFDDLMDWREDLHARNLNRSSVLYYIKKRLPAHTTLGTDIVMSSFLSEEFVAETYGAMLRHLRKARDVADTFRNRYLSTFMREQLEFHSRRRDELMNSGRTFFSKLAAALAKDRSLKRTIKPQRASV